MGRGIYVLLEGPVLFCLTSVVLNYYALVPVMISLISKTTINTVTQKRDGHLLPPRCLWSALNFINSFTYLLKPPPNLTQGHWFTESSVVSRNTPRALRKRTKIKQHAVFPVRYQGRSLAGEKKFWFILTLRRKKRHA